MKNLIKTQTSLLTMPIDLFNFAMKTIKSSSPYNRYSGGSFYSQEEKSWDFTPENTIRISDHWNFYSRGKTHCVTDIDDSLLIGKWVVAQYNNELDIYNVISIDEKDFTALRKREARQNNTFTDQLEAFSKNRMNRAREIRLEKERLLRAKKIKQGKIWITFEVNIWQKGSKGRFRHCGMETIVGQLTWESKTGKSLIVKTSNGNLREFRAWTNYKELKRKPYTKKTKSLSIAA